MENQVTKVREAEVGSFTDSIELLPPSSEHVRVGKRKKESGKSTALSLKSGRSTVHSSPISGRKKNFQSPSIKKADSEVDFQAATEDDDESFHQRSCHPFFCRLDETAAFNITSTASLTGAGFASFGIGLMTIFRLSPMLLYNLANEIQNVSHFVMKYKQAGVIIMCAWMGCILFVMLILGFIPACGNKIKRRWILLIHPWGLLLLYFDFVVWVTLTAVLHVEIFWGQMPNNELFGRIYNPYFFFSYIYIESFVFMIIYYLYATYFIAAELTVIERFF